jgi:4-carboxymuconolactone decarboxylase
LKKLAKAPAIHGQFLKRFPELGQAWDLTGAAGERGPLDRKTQRLVKLAIGMGALREGAVHSGVRKALAVGATREELHQLVALAAGTVGFSSAVALYSWVEDEATARRRPRS